MINELIVAFFSIASDWNQVLNSRSNRLYQLPLDIILKNNVALSYLLDFMTSLGSQAYIFFLLNAEGKDYFEEFLKDIR